MTAQDLAYREQLGVAGGAPLPTAAGATHVGAGETPSPRRRTRRKRDPNTSSKAAQKSAGTSKRGANAAAARGKLLARSPGICPGCGKPYPKGAPLGRIGEGWGHEACAKIMAETEKIRSGATFRSQRASTWRRGAGPGKTRDRF
ncbi:hypothetical protein [Amycolatopsis thermoflava]|uniref:hypothetical protein n=1 Tax=Amycolatopsis thermoflava TaxID=84480 RepID=UPI003D72A716